MRRPATLSLQRARSGSVMSIAIPEDSSSPRTPTMFTPPLQIAALGINPRSRMLRRSSSTSTLGSLDGEEEAEWSETDTSKLLAVNLSL